MSSAKTSDQILDIARELLQSGGVGAVSFDAIARRLGRSKQAVLYWFPTKHELLAAMFLPWLEAEAEVANGALADCSDRSGAITAFVRAIAAYHFENLDRFRMMYLVPQTIKPSTQDPQSAAILEKVHPVTKEMYSTLAAHLDGDEPAARRDAVAIHAAVLGLVLMVGLADSLHDPLKHSEAELVDALIVRLTGATDAPA
jgi:AcrR family transcriptional regulator